LQHVQVLEVSGLVQLQKTGRTLGRADPPRYGSSLMTTLINAHNDRQSEPLPHARLHDLRHVHATTSWAKNVPDRVIMEVLGHAEIGVTMNTYAQVLPILRQEAADAIDELSGA
jgi:integrase